ncbi:MAG: glycosyltransferase family 2 protein [Chryseolinea sp.]
MPKIGLVTVLFNSDSVLAGFFKSLSCQTFKDYHLYIIDNTPALSTTTLINELCKQYPISGTVHIQNEKNVGVAKGNNQGIELSRADGCSHTLLLNNDIEFQHPQLISKIYEYSVSKNEPIIVPKILFYDSRKIWLAGGRFSRMKGVAYHIGIGDEDSARYDTPAHFEYSPTCFMLIDNNVFNKVGTMDERYFVYYDDTDFIYRAIQSGYQVFYFPEFSVLHKVSSSTGGEESLFSIYFTIRNRIFFIRKNFSGFSKFMAITYTLLTRTARWILFSDKKKKELIRAVRDGFQMKVSV